MVISSSSAFSFHKKMRLKSGYAQNDACERCIVVTNHRAGYDVRVSDVLWKIDNNINIVVEGF